MVSASSAVNATDDIVKWQRHSAPSILGILGNISTQGIAVIILGILPERFLESLCLYDYRYTSTVKCV